MRNIDFDLLMNDVHGPVKDQVLIHALCELKGLSFNPNLGAISTESLMPKYKEFCNAVGTAGYYLPRDPEFSINMKNIIRSLISRGVLSENDLKNKIAVLMESVYGDPGYISCMGPFF